MSEQEIRLKWRTLKGWSGIEPETTAAKLLERYHELPVSMSVMMQRDTAEQKKILCELVSLPGMKIYLDWDGKYIEKEEAITYLTQDVQKESVTA